MNAIEFNVMLESRIAKMREVLASKAAEYTPESDRMHNFKAAARVQNTTAPRAWLGMWTKHLVSVIDMINRFDPDDMTTWPGDRLVDEKLGDLMNYIVLLEAIFREKIGVQNPANPIESFTEPQRCATGLRRED